MEEEKGRPDEIYMKRWQNRIRYVYSRRFNLNAKKNFARWMEKGTVPSKYLDFIKQVAPILNRVFPGRWDIQFVYEPIFERKENFYGYVNLKFLNLSWVDFHEEREGQGDRMQDYVDNTEYWHFKKLKVTGLSIVIHFPKINITNKNKQVHELLDLYVSLDFTDWGEKTLNMLSVKGTRGTVTIAEAVSKYRHSHLPRMPFKGMTMGAFINFCTGTSDLVNTMSMYNMKNDFDETIFELLLHQVEPHVSWESLEGGPHVKMADSLSQAEDYGKNINIGALEEAFGSEFVDALEIKSSLAMNIDWKFVNGRYTIVDNEKFETWLTKVVSDAFRGCGIPGDKTLMLLYKDAQGNYFQRKDDFDKTLLQEYPKHFIPFKGEAIPFKIIGEVKEVTNVTQYAHPKIKKYVKYRLECKANDTTIKDSIYGRRNTLNHTESGAR